MTSTLDDAPVARVHSERRALLQLRVLLASGTYACACPSPAAYRAALLNDVAWDGTQSGKEARALLASDAYACTFQSFDGYRSALLSTVDQYLAKRTTHD